MDQKPTNALKEVPGLQVHTAAMRPFFDIPVYRLSQEQYDVEFARYEARLDAMPGRIAYDDMDEQQAQRARRQESFGGVWIFNEVVGYVRPYFLGSQVRAHLFMAGDKRYVRTRKKQFSYRTHKAVCEMDLPKNPTSDGIYRTVLEYLAVVRKELAPRYLDTSAFEQAGPYVDWVRLWRS